MGWKSSHSGSKAFVKALGEGAARRRGLIGQFGVGFYSFGFMVAVVKVYTLVAQVDQASRTSDGAGSFAIEESAGERRGCKIVVEEARDEACSEYSQEWRAACARSSSATAQPLCRSTPATRINTVQALWLHGKGEIRRSTTSSYKFQAHDSESRAPSAPSQRRYPLSVNASSSCPKDNTEVGPSFSLSLVVLLRKRYQSAQTEGSPPGMAALPQGRRRQRGPPPQHLPRDDAGPLARREAEQGHTSGSLKFLGGRRRTARTTTPGSTANLGFPEGGAALGLHPQGRALSSMG